MPEAVAVAQSVKREVAPVVQAGIYTTSVARPELHRGRVAVAVAPSAQDLKAAKAGKAENM